MKPAKLFQCQQNGEYQRNSLKDFVQVLHIGITALLR